jgi:hypothetical protein
MYSKGPFIAKMSWRLSIYIVTHYNCHLTHLDISIFTVLDHYGLYYKDLDNMEEVEGE